MGRREGIIRASSPLLRLRRHNAVHAANTKAFLGYYARTELGQPVLPCHISASELALVSFIRASNVQS